MDLLLTAKKCLETSLETRKTFFKIACALQATALANIKIAEELEILNKRENGKWYGKARQR